MARDGSGGVGWLITFAVLALLGLIGSGILLIDSSNAHKQAKQAEDARATAQQQVTNLSNKVGILSTIIKGTSTTNADVIKSIEQSPGYAALAGDADFKAMVDGFKQKIELFGANYTEARSLNSLVTYLVEELNRKNAALVTEQVKNDDLRKSVASAIEENKKIAEEAVKGQQKAEADLTAARGEFEKQLAGNNAKLDDTAKKLEIALGVQRQIPEALEKVAAKDKEMTGLRDELGRLRNIIERPDADLAKVPVADVIFANQLTDTITINRGLQDGLRRQMTLSVFGKDETNIARATPKASVEVVQVTEPHRAECRIVSGKTNDPIIKGDVLYTPAWKPGQKVRFALGPNMDLDGDGDATADELETLMGLIALNGGVVDAYVDPAGEIKTDKESGGVSYATRFYVVGLSPRRDQKEVAAKLEDEAKKHGVEKINVGKLLDYMGYSVKRATRSIVNSPTPIIERRPPGAAKSGEEAPPAEKEKPAAEGAKEPAGEDPFSERKPPEEGKKEEEKKPAAPGDDPFANP